MTACAAFSKESRIRFANANKLDRKSGGAKSRDLQFSFLTYGSRKSVVFPTISLVVIAAALAKNDLALATPAFVQSYQRPGNRGRQVLQHRVHGRMDA